MTRKKLLMLLGSICLALMLVLPVVAGCAATTPTPTPTPTPAATEVEYIIRFASHSPPASQHCVVWKDINPILYEKTNGRMRIEVYPSEQLGDDQAMIAMLSDGSLEMMGVTASKAAMAVPWASLFDYPFLVDTWDDYLAKFYNYIKPRLDEDLHEMANIRLIGSYPWGFHAIMLARGQEPVRTIDDLKGLKIRVMSSGIYLEAFKAYGMNAIVIPYSELLTAMEQGVVDGYAIVLSKAPLLAGLGDVTGPIARTQHMFTADVLMTSAAWLDSLPSDLRESFLECADIACKLLAGRNFDDQQEAYPLWEEAGAKIYPMSQAERDKFKERLVPVYEFAVKEYGKEALDNMGITPKMGFE